MTEPKDIRCVIPSRLGVGESFSVKVRVLGSVRKIESAGGWNTYKPGLRGPFNLNVQRQIQFMDNCLPEWAGTLEIDAAELDGDTTLAFNGRDQGIFPGDVRPIKVFDGFKWTRPGFHFLKLTDPVSGIECLSNPCYVSEAAPSFRIFWGDPHWQTYFSDGIRCPEELYAFARDQGFLDFGAISDHMEGVSDRQWDYFQAVTNDYNEPGRFVTLQGQEWTHHVQEHGAPGHRNIYYRGDGGPALRCTDPDCNTLEKLWTKLDAMRSIDAVAIPHHSANVIMGVDWDQGWNPKYEKAVEIHSVWGSSEKHADDGNPMPMHACKGEMHGRHVIDALRRGYRFGFVGGGDIHDGRPGDDLHNESYPPRSFRSHPEGFTAAIVSALTREDVFDAIVQHRTYATSKSRIYLDAPLGAEGRFSLAAASEEGIKEAVVVRNGEDAERFHPDDDSRVVQADEIVLDLGPGDFCYVRVVTEAGHMAWSSPFYPARE